jgi:selenocysteine-specific elongation factor
LVESPLRWDRAELVLGDAAAEGNDLVRALRDELAANPFGAPEADRLHQLGLDKAVVARLHRDGRVLRLAENVVLLPEAEEEAVARQRTLPQPFGVSQARQVLGTTRRVALPLLAHLDRHRRTLRLPDDRRVVRGRGSSGIASET